MYTLTETCYNRTCTEDYESLGAALRDACTTLDQLTDKVTHILIVGNGLTLTKPQLLDIANKAPDADPEYTAYFEDVARTLE